MAKIKKYGQSAVSGKDIRLKKKIKPANQGGGPNHLGKVETVTVPKQWLSSPDHVVAELAYITPAEQKLLIEADLYGSLNGKPNRGPAGLLSLQGDMGPGGGGNYGGGGSEGENEGRDSNRGSDSGRDSGGFTAAERAAGELARAAIDEHNAAVAAGQRPGEGSTNYTQQFGPDVANAMAQNEKNRLAQQVAQSYIDYAPIMGPELYSAGNVGGSLLDFFKTGSTGSVPIRSNYFDDPTTLSAFKDIALGQIPGRMDKAKAGYGMPGGFGAAMGAMGQFTLGRMQKALEEGGRPVFDKQGRLAGVFSEGLFGEVYTGMPVEGVEGTGYDSGGDDRGQEQIQPVNPATGQCEPGYKPDPDMAGFCRLDTRAGLDESAESEVSPGTYARLGLLDVAPTGLSDFATRYGLGPQDFDAANLAYRRGAGTQFDIYKDPYQKEGYTLLA